MSYDFLDDSDNAGISAYLEGKEDAMKEIRRKIIQIIGKDSSSSEAPMYERISESRPEDFNQDRIPYNQLISYADEMMYKIEAIRDSLNLTEDTY